MKRVLVPALAGVMTLAATGSYAGSNTSGNFKVQITIQDYCTINTPADLVFPTQAAFIPAAGVSGTTTVTVNCTKNTAASIGLTGTIGSRVMTSGSDTIAYDLYQDSSHSVTWDDTAAHRQAVTGAGVDNTGATLNSGQTTKTIYGFVNANQSTNSAGTYQDTVQAIVHF